MIELKFTSSIKKCPICGEKPRSYKTVKRIVRSVNFGTFIASEKILQCNNGHERIIFRSETLASIIAPYCKYANDVMIESADKRFIEGKSCSEIATMLGIGMSERQVANLSNMALEIFAKIHEENSDKIRNAMNSYILQIDGTVDSEYSMIVAVRDTISDFVLYVKKCRAESYEEIKSILKEVKDRFGMPEGIISDMRAGILLALNDIFPKVPKRICLMHFLRDLGKELMYDYNKGLDIAINRQRIKAPLKEILKSLPEYNVRTLYEIEQCFCTSREILEGMGIRRILEVLFNSNGSSGYGFPFSLKPLNFYYACKEAENKIQDLYLNVHESSSKEIISEIMGQIKKVTDNENIKDLANKLSDINRLFQKLRFSFNIPEKGKLSDKLSEDGQIQNNCNILIGEMEVYMHENIADHVLEQ